MPPIINRMLIGLDVDGVITDFVGALLNTLHQRTGRLIHEEQIQSFDLTEQLTEVWQVAQDILSEPGFARSLVAYPNAIDGINRLRQLGRVVFVTTPFHPSPTWSNERAIWLQEHAQARTRDIVHASDKTLFCGHVLIDDSPGQLQNWVDSGRPAIRVVRPWNQNAPGIPARSWDEIVDQTRNTLEQIARDSLINS